MPETKIDKRFATHTGMVLGGMAIVVLAGAGLGFAANRIQSTGLWIALGLLLAVVASIGIGYSAWVFRYYRCPQCHARLRPERGERTKPLRIRYHCEDCNVIWDSGITWGAE